MTLNDQLTQPKLLATIVFGVMLAVVGSNNSQAAMGLPNAKIDMPLTAKKGEQIAVFSGGCFWGIEAVFEHVKGVNEAWSGYAGGTSV